MNPELQRKFCTTSDKHLRATLRMIVIVSCCKMTFCTPKIKLEKCYKRRFASRLSEICMCIHACMCACNINLTTVGLQSGPSRIITSCHQQPQHTPTTHVYIDCYSTFFDLCPSHALRIYTCSLHVHLSVASQLASAWLYPA